LEGFALIDRCLVAPAASRVQPPMPDRRRRLGGGLERRETGLVDEAGGHHRAASRPWLSRIVALRSLLWLRIGVVAVRET
jgi:hypothetical protein